MSNIRFTCVHSIECVIHTDVTFVLKANFFSTFFSFFLFAIRQKNRCKTVYIHTHSRFSFITSTTLLLLCSKNKSKWVFLLLLFTLSFCRHHWCHTSFFQIICKYSKNILVSNRNIHARVKYLFYLSMVELCSSHHWKSI